MKALLFLAIISGAIHVLTLIFYSQREDFRLFCGLCFLVAWGCAVIYIFLSTKNILYTIIAIPAIRLAQIVLQLITGAIAEALGLTEYSKEKKKRRGGLS